jgi:cell division protein FtsZ
MDQGNGLRFSMSEADMDRTLDGNGKRKVGIKVVGVGGAGGNAVNRMIASGLDGVEFIAVNTDFQDLEKSLAPTKVPIGQKLTRGLGTGGVRERGEKAAIEDTSAIMEHLQGADLIFIAAGMGGGTGTGAAPVVARLAAETGALTVAVVTRPFTWEGKQREANARAGLDQLTEAAATLIVIPNDNLFAVLPEDVSCEDAFQTADDVLRQGVQGISDLIMRPGVINLDFEDARSVLSAGGRAVMGMGTALGPDRALQAAEKAANNPLLQDGSIMGAKSILINFTGDRRLGLREVQRACEFVREKAHPDVNVIFGTSLDETLGDELRVTVVAAAFETELRILKRPAFTAAQALLPEAVGAMGSVPGVDCPLPAPAAATSVEAASASGFFRRTKDLFTPTSPDIFAAPNIPGERNYEEFQTPPFIRKQKS